MQIPPFLQSENSIAVVAPSSTANEADVRSGCAVLESWGLKVELGKSVFKPFGRLGSSDQNRLKDLQTALDNPEIKAIICTRGGYGLSRIVGKLDWTKFRQYPKWIIGYSDVTILLQAAGVQGITGVHGPMVVHLAQPVQYPAVSELHELLFGRIPAIRHSLKASTKSAENEIFEGPFVGGNLTLLANTIGTSVSAQIQNRILFLEEIDEPDYKVDRMLVHLHESGCFDSVKAIVLGHFTDCNPGEFPFNVVQSLQNLLGDNFPIFEGFPAGHESPSYPFIHGGNCRIEKKEQTWLFSQTLTASGLFEIKSSLHK
jgi:muramoyltetrapeptide carboxypeptidase